KASGKYVAFFETDMAAHPLWIRRMVDYFEKHPEVGAAHSRVFDLRQKKYIQADGMMLVPHTGWVIMRNYGLTVKSADSTISSVVIGSVGTMARRRVLLQIGGFDTVIGHKVDDIDLGWRIWLAGYKTVCLPNAVTYHWGGKPQSARPISIFKAEKYFNRMPRVFIKNYELGNLVKFLPWLVLLHLARSIKHLFLGNFIPFLGFVHALGWTIWTLPDTLIQRQKIQSQRIFSDQFIMDQVMIKGSFFHIWSKYILPLHQIAHSTFSK
ncbi:MAG: glycosyltransferase, partial [Patescibacteria group bacterium]